MAQWKNTDNTANSVLWAPTGFNKAPTAANRDALYGNTTANAMGNHLNQTVGMFGVDINEVQANRKVPHTGWVLKKVGTGGRAGRVQYEVLVAGSMLTDNAADNPVFPNYSLHFLTMPANGGGVKANNDVAAFSVSPYSTPSGATIAYLWEYSANANIWANASSAGMSGYQTANLTLNTNTVANGFVRVTISSANGGAANLTSNVATYTTT